MSTVRIRSAFRAFPCLLLAGLLVPLCVTGEVAGQIKSNLSSSVTSESMTAVWVARERGLFKKHGLDMQFILMPRNPLAVAALIAGEIDAAIIGPGHLVNAGLSGADLIGVANFHQKLDYRLNARPDIKKARTSVASESPSAIPVRLHKPSRPS